MDKLKKRWLDHLFRNVTQGASNPQNDCSTDGFFWRSVAVKSSAKLKISDKARPEIFPEKPLKNTWFKKLPF